MIQRTTGSNIPLPTSNIVSQSGSTFVVNDCVIQGNQCYDTQGTKTQARGIEIGGSALRCVIEGNNLLSNANSGVLLNGGTTHTLRNNQGAVGENSGVSTGTGAQQTIVHNMDLIPTTILLSEGTTGGALAYVSAAADTWNIYVTATNGKTYTWKASA